jgi:two-component system response regulator AtoC
MLNGRQILLLEDESLLRRTLDRYLESLGAVTYPVKTLAEARSIMSDTELDFALLDIQLPDGRGTDLLSQPGFSATTTVVMMTADSSIQGAVEAIRKGAAEYLTKPFDPEELPMVFARAAREKARLRKDEFEREALQSPDTSLFMGARLRAIRQQLDKILAADARIRGTLPPVLVEGETGTGKSTIARWLHENGPRRQAPLIEINCSTLPESLAEAELFGHEKGAFTDARKERIGLFEAADGGTLFLDEISSLAPALQAKVLTAIEDHRIRRVGGNTLRQLDVRLVAASLHPLKELAAKGEFREDLYHRLNLLHLTLPPLRDYPEDLPALTEHLLGSLRRRYRLPKAGLSAAGKARLISYRWPGNVRELQHELERHLIFSETGLLDLELLNSPHPDPRSHEQTLLNPEWTLPDKGFDFEKALHSLTDTVIQRILNEENGNVSAAARRLGVSRDFIRYRLDQSTGK